MSGGRTQEPQPEAELEAELEALQCHFTWDLDAGRSQLLRLRDKLEDIGAEEGYSWLGHIYNLQGYVHLRLGFAADALRFFGRAAEAFRQMRNTVSDEGPWLVVNYGNLAWLHRHLGEPSESRAYLNKVDALLEEYPSPRADELHPEICAEKAWTLMKFGAGGKARAAGYFQTALRMQPDTVEWHSSYVLALAGAQEERGAALEADIFEKMKVAKEHEPENLYLAALYLEACAGRGKRIEEEARDLARRVLRKPVSSYSGIKPLLRLYGLRISLDEAIDLSEEALERHPGERYLKACVASCYVQRIVLHRDNPPEQSMLDRAVSIHRQVIAHYPGSALKWRISLANIYAESGRGREEAEQIFRELLEAEREPEDRQMLFNAYARHLSAVHRASYQSIEFHMMAAAIPRPSAYRRHSIEILGKIRDRRRNRMCGEIEEFLAALQE